MAMSVLLRKFTSTTTSPFLTKLRHHKPLSLAVFPPLTTRFFASITNKDNQENDNRESHHQHSDPPGPPEAFEYEHPFQTRGSKEAVEVHGTEDGTSVRLALPGVGENGYRVWVDGDTVFFQAKADVDFKADQPRTYGGSLQFRPEFNRPEGVQAEIKNGILKLFLFNADGVDFEQVDK